MRKLAVAVALASTALATPALARDNAWYVEVGGGPMIVEDLDLDITGATPVNNFASVDHDYGYDFGGAVGYDFGGFRAEAEVSYRNAQVESITAGAPGIPDRVGAINPVGPDTGLVTGTYDINGRSSALSFMLNGMLDFGDDDGIQGFVGGGAGVARVKHKAVFADDFVNDSDTGFAWQALAGIRAPLSRNIDVGLKYRFFNADNVDLVDQRGRGVETRFRSHSILGTLTANFGAPAVVLPPVEAPVVVAPPPPVIAPPPPPPVVQCNTGPYIVYFDWDRSDITADAAATLDNAISAYQNCNNAQIMLAGHADRSGSATYNVGLSQRRNASVQGYLTSRGVNGGAITTQAFGESRPRVETADGVRNDQNRRVEIMYGPNAGM